MAGNNPSAGAGQQGAGQGQGQGQGQGSRGGMGTGGRGGGPGGGGMGPGGPGGGTAGRPGGSITPEPYEPDGTPISPRDSGVPYREDDRGRASYNPFRSTPDGGQAAAPYYEVWGSYDRAMEDAIAREEVPPAYRDHVREYFESLNEAPGP